MPRQGDWAGMPNQTLMAVVVVMYKLHIMGRHRGHTMPAVANPWTLHQACLFANGLVWLSSEPCFFLAIPLSDHCALSIITAECASLANYHRRRLRECA